MTDQQFMEFFWSLPSGTHLVLISRGLVAIERERTRIGYVDTVKGTFSPTANGPYAFVKDTQERFKQAMIPVVALGD